MSTLDPQQLQTEFARALLQAASDANQLLATLTEEHQHLKNNDLDAFQALQTRKQHDVQTIQLFEALRSQFCARIGIDSETPDFSEHLSDESTSIWHQLIAVLKQCDELHHTSDIYMRQRLDSINKALEVLQLNKPSSATNLYNKLGNTFTASQGRSLSKA
ncbi:MAG: flagellar protein FlgN [Gammaproteobacteria bacterium]|nr:flagellar protein FlgN [Gammaproteobacteria bacterium]MDP6166530.1 flagellar protein FlgN [Gammaproteobacteria bacterium]